MKNLLKPLTKFGASSELPKLITEWENSDEGRKQLWKVNQLARTLLDKIKEINLDVEVTVAGGFFLDLLLNRLPKDIDVWLKVRSEDELDFDLLDASIPRWGEPDRIDGGNPVFEDIHQTNSDEYGAVVNETKFTTYDTHFWYTDLNGRLNDAWTNIIPLFQPMNERVVDRFDYGICQIWWTPSEGIQYTEAFENDFMKKELTPLIKDIDPSRTNKLERKLGISKQKVFGEPGSIFFNTLNDTRLRFPDGI